MLWTITYSNHLDIGINPQKQRTNRKQEGYPTTEHGKKEKDTKDYPTSTA